MLCSELHSKTMVGQTITWSYMYDSDLYVLTLKFKLFFWNGTKYILDSSRLDIDIDIFEVANESRKPTFQLQTMPRFHSLHNMKSLSTLRLLHFYFLNKQTN